MRRLFKKLIRFLTLGHPMKWGDSASTFHAFMECKRCGRIVEVCYLNSPPRVVRVIKSCLRAANTMAHGND